MRCYAVYGGCLASDMELPDLSESSSSPTWTSRFAAGPCPERGAVPIGERPVGPYCYRLYRIEGGLRLELTERYRCDLMRGREIVWYRHEECEDEVVRALLLGPVLALALEAEGALCLHGSAVVVEGEAIAFLAPKYHGKSTLALALLAAGARLLTDDTLAVLPGPPASALPGVHSVRLWRDASERLRTGEVPGRVVPGHKLTLASFKEGVLAREPVKLSAAYVLYPVSSGGDAPAAERWALPEVAAIMELAENTKLSRSLIGRRAAATQLQRATALAESVPVFALSMARDFARLPEVVDQILRWHRKKAG